MEVDRMKINDISFQSPDNCHKNYWLGFISHSAVIENEKITIKTRKNQELHLHKLAKDLNIKKFDIQNHHENCQFTIKNTKLANDLTSCKPRMIPDYWRGVIDAAGRLSEERPELKLATNDKCCTQFLKFCRRFVATRSNVKTGCVKLHGKMALKIAQLLYSNSLIHLDQNYKIYSKWEQSYNDAALFPSVVNFFHKIIPQEFNVKRCKITSSLEGDCSYKNNKYYIRINDNLNDKESINTLLHELAHIGTMLEQEDDLHGSAFGMAYSRIYKQYEAEFT